MRKKSTEELRAANRERQARWRKRNKWVGQQRKLAVYGKSEAQKKLAAAASVSNNVVNEYERGPIEGYDTGAADERGGGARGAQAVKGIGRSTPGIEEGDNFDQWGDAQGRGADMEPLQLDGIRGVGIEAEGLVEKRGMRVVPHGTVGGSSGDTVEDAVERLRELVKRQARGGLNAGVEVELEL